MKTFVLTAYEMCYGHGNAGEWRFLCVVTARDITSAAKKLGGKTRESTSSTYFNEGRRTARILQRVLVARHRRRGRSLQDARSMADRELGLCSQFTLEPAPLVR